jgi:23S rRNA U2552 (ribose-2'-O)-methylase RlmE/FtsJ
MQLTFQELIETRLVVNINQETLNYLDVGYHSSRSYFDDRCNPGGFSLVILQSNENAKGEGIALPKSQGGIQCLLPPSCRPRIRIHSHDVTRYNLSPNPIDKPVPLEYTAVPFSESSKFDLVLLDAHRFETGNETPVGWEPQRMLLSQLIIAFEYTAADGVVIIRLGNPQRDQTAAVLYILSQLFQAVKIHKPVSSHQHRGSFYAVATGFQNDCTQTSLLRSVIKIMRDRWWEATFGGEDGKGINPLEWWEEIVLTDHLPTLFGEKLLQLALPVWKTQIAGLEEYFIKNGIDISAATGSD